jgi:hypothetical protein
MQQPHGRKAVVLTRGDLVRASDKKDEFPTDAIRTQVARQGSDEWREVSRGHSSFDETKDQTLIHLEKLGGGIVAIKAEYIGRWLPAGE